jgi:hypothetical protein
MPGRFRMTNLWGYKVFEPYAKQHEAIHEYSNDFLVPTGKE